MEELKDLLSRAAKAGFTNREVNAISRAIEDLEDAGRKCDFEEMALQIYGLGSFFGSHAQYVKIDPWRMDKEWMAMEDVSNKTFNLVFQKASEYLSKNCKCALM